MKSRWLMIPVLGLACLGACGDDDAMNDESKSPSEMGDHGDMMNDEEPDEESCTTQMFAKYGKAGFEAVTVNILENIGTVSALNPSPIGDSFKGLSSEDVARVEANLFDFLVMVYGGPNHYEGRSMKASHKGLGITQAQYDAFITMVVVPALTKAGVPESDVGECFAPPVTDPAFVASIVEE